MQALRDFVRAHPRLFVLTGAGLSTASGIPAYRDEAGRWMRRQPIQAQAFARDPAARKRYWARSMVGWPMLERARPNAGHLALARLQAGGLVQRIVTQNVDGLHQQAGSHDVLELHGSVAEVICLACARVQARRDFQQRLEAANPRHAALHAAPHAGQPAAPAPDGDADLEGADLERFEVPACPDCGGTLKPRVVFFGDSVPRQRVEAALHDLQQAQALLVVGSSLMLQSGYRFCVAAERLGKPMAAVNLGTTRADALLGLKVRRRCEEALAELFDALAAPDNRFHPAAGPAPAAPPAQEPRVR